MVVEPVLVIGSDVGQETTVVEKLDEARFLDLLNEGTPASHQGAVVMLCSRFWASGKERSWRDEPFHSCPDSNAQLPGLAMEYLIFERLESTCPLSDYIISSVIHNQYMIRTYSS